MKKRSSRDASKIFLSLKMFCELPMVFRIGDNLVPATDASHLSELSGHLLTQSQWCKYLNHKLDVPKVPEPAHKQAPRTSVTGHEINILVYKASILQKYSLSTLRTVPSFTPALLGKGRKAENDENPLPPLH